MLWQSSRSSNTLLLLKLLHYLRSRLPKTGLKQNLGSTSFPAVSMVRFWLIESSFIMWSEAYLIDFSSQELQQLSRLPIVPIPPEQSGPFSLRWLPPIQCYFGGDAKNHFHSKLFVFVDFGTRANAFLSACGTKHEPSVEEVVLTLLDNPHKFYSLTEGSTQ